MVNSDRGADSPEHGRTDETVTVQVLYVDPDDEARDDVEAVVSGREGLEITTAPEFSSVRSITRPESVDCIVGTPDVLGDHEALPELETVPTVLYAAEDPTDIDDDVLSLSDSLVQKGAENSARLLVEKILGIVDSRNDRDRMATTVRKMLTSDLQGVGVFVVDETGHVEWASVDFEELFPTGTHPASRAGVGDLYARLAVLVGDDQQAIADLLALRGSEGGRIGAHLAVSTKDEERQYLHTSRPLGTDVAGDRVEIFVDVTTLATRYERLAQFENLVENAEDGLFVLDADGRIEYCNRSYVEVLGYDREDIVGEHASKFMASGEIEKGHDLLTDLMEEGRDSAVVDIRLETHTGEPVDTSVHFSVRQSDDGYPGLMGVLRDITARKRRERQLEQYQTLVESAADPMYVLDEDGDIQILNRAMAEFVGQERESLVGTNVTELLSTDNLEPGRDALRRILSEEENQSESFEVWLTNADGTERLFEVTVSAIVEDGTFEGSVATFRDMTERHNREEELDLRKQVFARSLRHNIRNETSVIHSYSSLLADELDGKQAEMAEAILESSQTLAKTSRKVNQFDWLVENDAENVVHDLFPLVKQCVEQVRATNPDAEVSVDIPASIRVLAVHDIDIGISNLVENALQHSDEASPPAVEISARVEGETVTLTVTDDGPGIPPSEIEVVEEGEETPLDHVSGLGLWLVEHVVTKSGGSLAFDVDDGTTVEVTLQRASVAK